MDFRIEKGVPLPPSRGGRSRAEGPKYPWAEMEVGDSFAVLREGQAGKNCIVQSRLTNAAAKTARVHGRRFTTRVVDADTVRVWRVA